MSLKENGSTGAQQIKKISLLGKLTGNPIFGVAIPLFVILAILAVFKPQFYSSANLQAVLRSMSFLGIIVVGQTMVMLTGDFDISVGSVAGFGAVFMAWLATSANFNPILAIITALILSCMVGVINGVCIVFLKLPPFITTIGTLYVVKGCTYLLTNGYPIYPLPEIFNKIGDIEPFGTSLAFVVFIALVIIGEFILRKTVYGRSLYIIGDNKEVAKLAGIRVNLIRISTFIIISFLAGLSGMLQVCQLGTANPSTGAGWEMQIVAATAIGGVSLMGGSGTIVGGFVGMVIMAVLYNGLVILGLNTHFQTVMLGTVMILAVLLDIIRRSRKMRA